MENDDSTICYYSGLPSPMAYMEVIKEASPAMSTAETARIVEMAREDKTTFDAIKRK